MAEKVEINDRDGKEKTKKEWMIFEWKSKKMMKTVECLHHFLWCEKFKSNFPTLFFDD